MPPIDSYVETFFWSTTAWHKVPDGWFRREAYTSLISAQFMVALERFGGNVCKPYPLISENVFDRLIEFGAIHVEENAVSGKYFCVHRPTLEKFQVTFLQSSDLYRQVQAIGVELFDDIFSVYGKGGQDIPDSHPKLDVGVPASDRIVSLNDNQISDLDEPLKHIIDELDKSNGNPEHPGFRERALGQLRAGRELIRAGTFKAYLLYSVLITALAEVAQRHQGTVIEGSIQALIALLVQHVFSGA